MRMPVASSASTTVIVGIDEAGRGALAGPVVAGACVLTETFPKKLIRDSKQMTPEKRSEAFEWIVANCAYGVGMVDASEIDRVGIMAANERAMQMAVASLAKIVTPTYLLVDGRDAYWFDYPHSSIIGGDDSEPCISAASIVAKVSRDRFMIGLHRKFPVYGFDGHKGYGSADHLNAIRAHGMTEYHRRTFIHL